MVFAAAHAIDIGQDSGAEPPAQIPTNGFAVSLDLQTSSANDLLDAIHKAQEKSAEIKAAKGESAEDQQEGLKILSVKDLPPELAPKVEDQGPKRTKVSVPLKKQKSETESKKQAEDKKAADQLSELDLLRKAVPGLEQAFDKAQADSSKANLTVEKIKEDPQANDDLIEMAQVQAEAAEEHAQVAKVELRKVQRKLAKLDPTFEFEDDPPEEPFVRKES